MKRVKEKMISRLLMFAMVLGLLMPGNVLKVSAEEAYDGYVYLTIEKSTLGQGVILEPVKVGYHNGDNVGSLIFDYVGADKLQGSTGYISGVYDGGQPEGWTKKDIPEAIFNALEGEEGIGGRISDNSQYLCGNDYTQYVSGWMYTVDDEASSGGMGDYKLMEANSGSVVRLQFSVYGWGSDIKGIYWDGSGFTKLWADFPSKLNLIKLMADYAGDKTAEPYSDALEILSDWDATAAEVSSAEDGLERNTISDTYAAKLGTAIDYLHKNTNPAFGAEWAVLGLARNQVEDVKWYKDYYDSVVSTVEENKSTMLDKSKSTENSRAIIGLSSIGADVTNIAGYDLTAPLADFSYVGKQGLNGYVYALIALDCGNYDIPTTAEAENQTTREKLVNAILEKKVENGGWTFWGTEADPDMTGMAIQALAPYYNTNAKVKAAVDEALTVLSDMQKENGGVASWGTENCESCAQVICALSALKIDADTDSRFVKNGNSVLDAMLSFYDESTGGFKHLVGGTVDKMASTQAAYALVAYDRFKNDKNSLYNMSDAACLYKCKADKHSWDNGKVTKEPTDKETGEEIYTCTVCGETEKKTLPVKKPANTEDKTEAPTGEATTTEELKKPTPGKTSLKKVTSPKKKQIKVTWNKKSGVTGYQIQVSTASSFKKSKTKTYTVKSNKTTSKTIKSLKSKKKYYVRIRTYKKVTKNGKSVTGYSAWSKKKTIKVK